MKKMLALLVALWLPMNCFAESTKIVVSIETSEGFQKLLENAMLSGQNEVTVSTNDAALTAALIDALINGLNLIVEVQDDSAKVEVKIRNNTLLDMVVHTSDEQVLITSSLFPGHAIKAEQADAVKQPTPELRVDEWEQILDELCIAGAAWFEQIDNSNAYGAFSGDVFDGGSSCQTIHVSDAELAELISAILDSDSQIIRSLFEERPYLTAEVEALNQQIASENRYTYTLRLVRNEADQLIGITAAVFDQAAQVATLSIGLQDNAINMVLGVGLDDVNHWWNASIVELHEDEKQVWLGTSREWQSPKQQGYSYTAQYQVPLASYCWRYETSAQLDATNWHWELYQGDDWAQEQRIWCAQGELSNKENIATTHVAYYDGSKELFSANFEISAGASVSAFDESLVICDLSDPRDEEELQAVLKIAEATLSARLLKLLPMNVLLNMNRFLIP